MAIERISSVSVFPKATCRHWWADSCKYGRIFVLVKLWIEELFSFQVDSAGDTKFPKPQPGDMDGFTVPVDSSSFTTDSNGSPLVITQTLYARKFKLPGNHDLRVFVGMLLAFACLIAALIVGFGSWFILLITRGIQDDGQRRFLVRRLTTTTSTGTTKSFKLSTDILVARIGVLESRQHYQPNTRDWRKCYAIAHTLSSSYIDFVMLSQTYWKVIRSRVTCYFYPPTFDNLTIDFWRVSRYSVEKTLVC